MNRWMGVVVLGLAGATPAVAQHTAPTEQQVEAVERSLHPQTGDVAIPQAGATLHLGRDFYYLNPAEAKRVLTEVWGNPPEAVSDALGLVLPAGKTITDNVWGAVVTWQPSGYVTDDDANSAEYSGVLDQLRSGEAEENRQRHEQGYPGMHLVGWAQPPSYDRTSHAMVWARDLHVDGAANDTLNYDVRLLGREGVLSLNMLAGMADLPDVRRAAAIFGRTAAFQPGQRYADFDAAHGDKRAGYGLAGLVAAGVGVVAAKKLGVLALVLRFGKKGLVLLAVAGAAVKRGLGKLFGRKGGDGEAQA
ncbi:DUF2167 domain-containing protein [Sphingomonas sp.]|uniref:DUF2167 domain-containing protein n=1 Tax=Sphingomonas sp. TaxID=28214 RepID=UPI003CC5880A